MQSQQRIAATEPNAIARGWGALCRLVAPASQPGRVSLWHHCRRRARRAARLKQLFETEKLLNQALELGESFGQGSPRHLLSLDELADYLESAGVYSEAESRYRQALALRERRLGPDHFEVASSLNNLALLHYTQGKFEEAGALYQRLLAILDRTLGPDHLETAQCLENYAALLRKLKRDEESEAFRGRAREIRRGASGRGGK